MTEFERGWKAAIEAAAKACEQQSLVGCDVFAAAIRALRPPSTAATPHEWESASCASCGRDAVPCKSDGVVWTCRDCLPAATSAVGWTWRCSGCATAMTPEECAAGVCSNCRNEPRGPQPAATSAATEPTYPCDRCGALRTKAEGGTTFTVCDACWDATTGAAPPKRCPFFSRAQGCQCDRQAGHEGWCSNDGDGFASGYDPRATSAAKVVIKPSGCGNEPCTLPFGHPRPCSHATSAATGGDCETCPRREQLRLERDCALDRLAHELGGRVDEAAIRETLRSRRLPSTGRILEAVTAAATEVDGLCDIIKRAIPLVEECATFRAGRDARMADAVLAAMNAALAGRDDGRGK